MYVDTYYVKQLWIFLCRGSFDLCFDRLRMVQKKYGDGFVELKNIYAVMVVSPSLFSPSIMQREYDSPPTGGSSIIYVRGEENQTVTYEGRTLKKNYLSNTSINGNEISRKTAVFYRDMNGSLKAAHLYVKNVNEVYSYYPKSNVEMVIGGNDYNLESWGGSSIKG